VLYHSNIELDLRKNVKCILEKRRHTNIIW
jgi:hypothetical protein